MVIGRVSGTGMSRGKLLTPLWSATGADSGLLASDDDNLRTLGDTASRAVSELVRPSARTAAFDLCLSGEVAGFGVNKRCDAEPPTHPSPNVPSSAPVSNAAHMRWPARR